MMQRFILGLIFLAANLAYCFTLPLEETTQKQSNVTIDESVPLVMGEAQVSSGRLNLKPYIEKTKSAEDRTDVKLNEPIGSEEVESAKSEPADTDIEGDYTFLPDKMPDLSDDEYLEIGDDNTPLNFLKGRDNVRLVKASASQKQPAALSPIYITVPIYINTAAGIPLQLSIGGQQVPLTTVTEKPEKKLVPSSTTKEGSPTSQFNRLLNHDDSIASLISTEQQKTSLRGTNRHRNNIRSNYGRLQMHAPAPTAYRNLGAYRIYI